MALLVVLRMEHIVELKVKVNNPNIDMRVNNPRVILLENIRQSCIYKMNTQDIRPYWIYMMQFSDTCGDINNPIFSEECAKNIINFVGLDHEGIEICMENEIKSIVY
jgi:uncharacterized protein YeeX (DUF496 family)